VVGVDCTVSLSHDDPWFAVALAPSRALRVGVDLCRRVHADRIMPILRHFTTRGVQLDPVVQWAALECVLKMRGLGITALLGTDAMLRREGRYVRVEGIGPNASLHVMDRPEFVVVWGSEQQS
jgi:phosphopantetheinyl transferase